MHASSEVQFPHHLSGVGLSSSIIPSLASTTTVNGRNPAPPAIYLYITLETSGQTTLQLVQDFFHQQHP